MVKKCLGSILLPEKHSLLYLSMLLRQELFTLNKNRRNGGGRKISNSPVYWRLAGWNSTQGGSRQELKRPNPWKPQTSLRRGTTETALLQPLDSKGKPVNIKSFFHKISPESNRLPLLPTKHSNHTLSGAPCPEVRRQNFPFSFLLQGDKELDYKMQTEL